MNPVHVGGIAYGPEEVAALGRLTEGPAGVLLQNFALQAGGAPTRTKTIEADGDFIERFAADRDRASCVKSIFTPCPLDQAWTLSLKIILNPFWWISLLLRTEILPTAFFENGTYGSAFQTVINVLTHAFSTQESPDRLSSSSEGWVRNIAERLCLLAQTFQLVAGSIPRRLHGETDGELRTRTDTFGSHHFSKLPL